MPEQLTKYPDVTLQVLRSAGAKCGAGAPQEILTKCPAPRFCKLPGGEICVYGLPEAKQMTQISGAEWQVFARNVVSDARDAIGSPELSVALTAFAVAGMAGGLVFRRRRHRQ